MLTEYLSCTMLVALLPTYVSPVIGRPGVCILFYSSSILCTPSSAFSAYYTTHSLSHRFHCYTRWCFMMLLGLHGLGESQELHIQNGHNMWPCSCLSPTSMNVPLAKIGHHLNTRQVGPRLWLRTDLALSIGRHTMLAPSSTPRLV
jgi:hypothetical protein